MMYVVDFSFQVCKQLYVNAESPERAQDLALAEVAGAPVAVARDFEAVMHTEVLSVSPMDILNFD